MLIISDRTYAALTDSALRSWLDTAVETVLSRHPAWSAEHGPEQIRTLCHELERFSRSYSMYQRETFLALVDLRVETGLELQPTPYQEYALSRGGFSEKLRVQRYIADVRMGSRTHLVDLPGVNGEAS